MFAVYANPKVVLITNSAFLPWDGPAIPSRGHWKHLCTEIHVADGAPLLLRAEKLESGKNSPVQTSATADAGTGGSSEVDLYEGLSDIDDIYQQQSEPAICADDECGVYEVDLGLDLVNALGT